MVTLAELHPLSLSQMSMLLLHLKGPYFLSFSFFFGTRLEILNHFIFFENFQQFQDERNRPYASWPMWQPNWSQGTSLGLYFLLFFGLSRSSFHHFLDFFHFCRIILKGSFISFLTFYSELYMLSSKSNILKIIRSKK